MLEMVVTFNSKSLVKDIKSGALVGLMLYTSSPSVAIIWYSSLQGKEEIEMGLLKDQRK